MIEFGKRLGWRVTGGIVTIALGAIAAAQAQRQDVIGPEPPPMLDSPQWATSLPAPIGVNGGADANSSGPNSMGPGFSVGFAGSLPGTDAFQNAGYDSGSNDAYVAQVNHEASASMQAPPESAPPAAPPSVNPAELMSMPFDPAAAYNEGTDEQAGPAVSMSLPAMGLPDMPPANDNAVDAGPAMAMPPGPSADLARMPEIQMDQGPAMGFPGGPDASQVPDQNMSADATNHQAAPAMMMGSYGGASSVPSNNQLRGDAPASNQLRSDSMAYSNESIVANQLAVPTPSQAMPQQLGPAPTPRGYTDNASLPQLPQPTAYPPASQPAQFAGKARSLEQSGLEQSGFGQPGIGQPPSNNPPTNQFAPNQPAGMNSLPPSRLASFGNVPAQRLNEQNMNEPISISSPGDRRLEGIQSPSVVIHKRAPAEVKVGQPATFVIQVRNVGSAEALGVQVHDRVPAGMQLIDATPAPMLQGDVLVWQLGALPAGDERSITMQLVPQQEGELGSVARVTFEAAASVRTRSTRPELKISQRAPAKVLIGQQLEIELEVANIGTGEATGVILQEDVPEGLDHPRGKQLDNALGSLRPGEVRREVLRLRAAAPGRIENIVRLSAEDAEPVMHSVVVEVIAPELNVQLSGPTRKFLERQATFNVNVENRGTAPATNVELIAYLDRGFTFVSTENEGQYDPNRHAVLWSLANLPAGSAGSVPLTLLPVQAGEQAIRVEAGADLNTRSQSESTVTVESQAELTFSISDLADPIELGSETTYEIRVQNAGSRNDTNVQVQLQLPPGIELLSSDADAGTDGRGGVIFQPHAQMPAGGELTYRVRVRGTKPDTHIIRAIVTSDQSQKPVTKEESTMVYADR